MFRAAAKHLITKIDAEFPLPAKHLLAELMSEPGLIAASGGALKGLLFLPKKTARGS